MSEQLAAALAAYIPRDRAAQIIAGVPLARAGVALIADISGFTPLTEALARALSPARGAEELTRVLDGIFAPLIQAAHAYGGSVVKFGGDALIVWFPRAPRSPRAAVLRRALAAAHAMQAAVAAGGQLATSAGSFAVTIKIGMAYGPVARLRLGDVTHGYEDVIGGLTLDRMAEAEHHAGPGEVVIDTAGLPELASVAPVLAPRGSFVLVGPPFRRPRPAPPAVPAPSAEHVAELRPYVPAELAEALGAGRAHPAELKPVVSIFVQFAGVQFEDEAAAEAQLAAYFGAAQRAAARFGGRVNRLITGDKGSLIHLIFGAPRALEELEARAARCAIELRAIAAALPFITAQRVGMATGRAFAGPVGAPARHDYTVIGDAINLSARLMQRAAPGQVVLDAALANRLGPAFAVAPLGPVRLKGKAVPVELFALEGEAAVPPAPPGERVFGRDAELARLRELVAAGVAGPGAVAVVIGELGMGKSHLLAALRHEPGARARWVTASAPAYGGRPGGALAAGALAGLLGLGPAAGYAELEAACAALLGPRQGGLAAPYLARLLGVPLDERRAGELAAMAGESLRWRLRELAGDLASAAAGRSPLVLALDDLQWADATSLDLLEAVLPVAARAPLALLLAARPDHDARAWPLLERLRAAGAPWLEFGPLRPADATALLRHSAPSLPEPALARLAERGGGNPLFLVELARAAAAAGPDADLPDSVQGLLLAQIDRLPAPLRDTLQRAALVGRAPALTLLAELDGRAGLEARLSALVGAGFLASDSGGYSFHHILVQESAYGALLYERRRAGHARVAAAIERLFPAQLAERSAELAGHYERAGNTLAAARYHAQAADGARLIYANEEAEAGYRRALALLDTGPGDERLRGRTLLKLAQVRMNAGDYVAAQELYDEAFALLEQAEAAEEARGRARRSPVFRMAADEPETLDPGLAAASAALEIAGQLFEGLVELDEDLTVVPAAARRWHVQDGGLRYLFELRPGLRWSDGAPLTALDFVAAWLRNLHPETGAALASYLFAIRGAAAFHAGALAAEDVGVRALDDATLEVWLEEPVGYFLALLTTPITLPQPAHRLRAAGHAWASAGQLVSNGPFTLRRWQRGESMELARNQRSRLAPRTALERARLQFVAPADERSQRDALDIYRLVDRAEPPPVEGSQLIALNRLSTYFLAFACDRAPTSRVELRRALAASLDKERLVQAVWGGGQIAAHGGIIPPGLFGHSPGIGHTFDPANARALLTGQRNVPRLALGALVGCGDTPLFLQQAWRQHLGIDVAIATNVPVERLLDGLRSGDFDLALLGWEAEYPDPDNFLRTLFHGASPANYFGWRSERFDRLVEAGARWGTQAERAALFHEADRLLVVEEVAVVPLYYDQTYALLRAGFRLAGGGRLVRDGRLRLTQIAPVQAPGRRSGGAGE